MTRINLLEPHELTDQHLMAERRELPRIFGKARPLVHPPSDYRLGVGHVLFFYNKTGFLAKRQQTLIDECLKRGFNLSHLQSPAPIHGLAGDWLPDGRAIALNRARLWLRLNQRPELYRAHGVKVGPDFYGAQQDVITELAKYNLTMAAV